MIKLILLPLLLVSFSALSNEKCDVVSDYAQFIMSKRQEGEPISELMKKVVKLNLPTSVVIDAYETPFRDSKKFKRIEVIEFSTRYYISCLKGG